MRTCLQIPLTFILALIAGSSMAQPVTQTHQPSARVELFGGYSRTADYDTGVNGMAVGIDLNGHGPIGIAVDMDLHRWTVPGFRYTTLVGSPLYTIEVGEREWQMFWLSVGPRLVVRRGRVSLFGGVTLDGRKNDISAGVVKVTPAEPRLDVQYNRHRQGVLGVGVLGGSDVRLIGRFAARIQASKMKGLVGDGPDATYRIKMGVVVGFGRI